MNAAGGGLSPAEGAVRLFGLEAVVKAGCSSAVGTSAVLISASGAAVVKGIAASSVLDGPSVGEGGESVGAAPSSGELSSVMGAAAVGEGMSAEERSPVGAVSSAGSLSGSVAASVIPGGAIGPPSTVVVSSLVIVLFEMVVSIVDSSAVAVMAQNELTTDEMPA